MNKHPLPTGDTIKIAAIVTEYRWNSHADVIVGRLLGDFDYQPQVEVVSLYTDQVPANNMSRAEAARCGIPIYPTIREAVLAPHSPRPVDGVVIIGEHGDYPMNDRRQKEYPRRRLLEETLLALEERGLTVPIFCDKHLAYRMEDATWMYRQLKERGIPFMGGSSIPFADPVPAFGPSLLKSARDFVVVSFSSALEAYGYHGMEVLQALAEQREGGETGIATVLGMEGEDVWRYVREAGWMEELLQAALSQYPAYAGGHPSVHDPSPALFVITYEDGTRGAVFQFETLVNQWGWAFRTDGGSIVSARIHSDTARPFSHFERLTRQIERFLLTRRPPFPMERTYFTTGMIAYGMESLYQGRPLATPELRMSYSASIAPPVLSSTELEGGSE
ncbi:hypothetical protein J31TS4_08610 [Paenibacillus sp. J31TS4]|uniref:hypothetical protein n=1 Tax=Paenibacillus sp. J31TS4 TaxID=2807195 RepID=UPI001B10047F|nr:hypothetical protein [Paenibacillus sp. J31TS4]GIP37581.1 hypothetical protein J31TS4_08610 [Paenibacillus sp. J31TS4]